MPRNERLPIRRRSLECACGARYEGPGQGMRLFAEEHAECGLQIPCPQCDAAVPVTGEAPACGACGVPLRWAPARSPSVI